MADTEQTPDTDEGSTAVLDEQTNDNRLELNVEIEDAGPCRKHVKVTVPRESIDEILDEQVAEFGQEAEVPGFRQGHVPDALIRKRFSKELAEKVKQQVLMLSLEQLAEEKKIDPINEPNLDVEGIELPEEGDFSYEFDIEVRPEFEMPEYKGITIERPVREVTDADVDAYTTDFLEQYAHLVPIDEPARPGDIVIVDALFEHNGEQIQEFQELAIRIRPVVRFYDAEISGFDELMDGAKPGDVREIDLTISMEADQIEMRGETVHARLTVLDVKRLEMPELNDEFFDRIDAESEDDLKSKFRSMLERQITYEQRQAVRRQVLEKITESADWDLPEDLVRKQVDNAMRREILEMQQAGFTTPEIRAREGELRQNSLTTTRQNLKQHFVLDRIAEIENIEVTPADIETEIAIMALQAGENPRRVRSRLMKSGMIDNLEAQIRERKAVDVVLENAQIQDVEMPPPMEPHVEGVNRSICGGLSDVDVGSEESAEE